MSAAGGDDGTSRRRGFDETWVILLYGLTFAVMALRAVALRYSTEACDDHLSPVNLLLSGGPMPRVHDCWECYHAKLFYFLQEGVFNLLRIRDPLTQLQTAAWMDWGFVGVTAFTLWLFLRWQRLTPLERAIAFAVPISAPGMSLVATMPSNDGPVIAFSAITIVAFFDWTSRRRAWSLGVALVFAALSAVSKGSGLVIFAGALAGVLVQPPRFWWRHRRQALLALALGAAGCVLVWKMGYGDNYRDTGNMLVGNIAKSPPPTWTSEKRRPDAGVNSYKEAYFGFPIRSELRVPYVSLDSNANYSAHRANLWTVMHGFHSYSRFSRWPSSWRATEPLATDVGRAEILFGLLPLALMVLGLVRRLASHAWLLVRRGPFRFVADREVWLTGTAVMMLAMMVVASASSRWFPSMKAFYAYPAMVAFTAALARGLIMVRGRWVTRGVAAVATLLVGLYALDATILANDLSRTFEGRAPDLAGVTTTKRDGESDLSELLPKAIQEAGHGVAGTAMSGESAYCDRAVYDHVIGATAPSSLRFAIDGKFSRFRVKVCDGARAPRTGHGVRFRILGDDKELWDSEVVPPRNSVEADVSIAGVRKLQLVVNAVEASAEDTPLWIDPMLTP
jgi:NPCBM/NEW2 domain